MKPSPKLLLTLLLTLLFAVALPAQTTCAKDQTPAQIDARIDQLIAQMTPEERIAQLGDQAPAIPRLHLPAYNWWNEGLHGVARNGVATVFPQAIGLAATFDAPLLQAVGDTVSTEGRAKLNTSSDKGQADAPRYGGLTFWSPNINIFRDPRWGRGQETYGEDPFLTATLGTRFIRGIQGDDPFYLKADATTKHFAAHSGPEEGRDSFNAPATPHDLADTYLPAFHTLTQTAAALMCSYNAIDGTPSCAGPLLQTRLRDLWHFQGYVVSDCDAVGNIAAFHHFAPDTAHGAALALKAGTDLDCGSSYNALNQSLAQGLVTQQEIDHSLHRLLAARLRLGLLDAPACTPFASITLADSDSPAHRALALRAAEESTVLLRNDGTLPLAPGKRLAVIGPTADLLADLEANYHGTASHPITPLTGLLAAFPNLRYAQGSVLAEGVGVGVPIPRTALRTSEAPNAPPGLKAEFFPHPSFDGAPTVTKVVPTLDLDINRAAPDPALPPTGYAARWTGVFIPPATGTYTLLINPNCGDCRTHSALRFYLDGKLVADHPAGKAGKPAQPIILNAADTKPHALRIEFLSTGDEEGLSLDWQPPAAALLTEAVQSAEQSDVIVAFTGLSPNLEGEALGIHLDGFNNGDRTSLDLPAPQLALLARLEALHKPLVLVLSSGSAVAIDPDHHANALLAAWYPGEEGGHALANVLTGKTNPSGRLPVTFYRSAADLPAFADYGMAHRTYRYFDGPVLYPFGSGLSYTTFAYSAIHLSNSSIQAGSPVTLTATVTNTGARAGDEVSQLYLTPPHQPGAPRLTLQGIERVHLAPHESRTLTFTLTPTQLSFVDPTGHRAIRPGDYSLYIGGSQPAKTAPTITLHIAGEKSADF